PAVDWTCPGCGWTRNWTRLSREAGRRTRRGGGIGIQRCNRRARAGRGRLPSRQVYPLMNGSISRRPAAMQETGIHHQAKELADVALRPALLDPKHGRNDLRDLSCIAILGKRLPDDGTDRVEMKDL